MNLNIPILKISSKIVTLSQVLNGDANTIKIFDFNEMGSGIFLMSCINDYQQSSSLFFPIEMFSM